MMEKQPQILLSTQAFRNAVTSGPSRRHMISGLVSIDRPCREYSGKHHQIHGAQIAPRFAKHVHDALGLTRQVGLGDHDRQLQLNEPDDDAIRRFVEAAKSVHVLVPLAVRSLA